MLFRMIPSVADIEHFSFRLNTIDYSLWFRKSDFGKGIHAPNPPFPLQAHSIIVMQLAKRTLAQSYLPIWYPPLYTSTHLPTPLCKPSTHIANVSGLVLLLWSGDGEVVDGQRTKDGAGQLCHAAVFRSVHVVIPHSDGVCPPEFGVEIQGDEDIVWVRQS